MLDKLPDSLVAKLSLWCCKPVGIVILTIAFTVFLAVFLGPTGLGNSPYFLWGASSSLALVASLIVALLVKPVKFKKSDIGILVAITTESTEAQNRLENDLVNELRRSLEAAGSNLPMRVKLLQKFHVPNLVDADTATQYAVMSGARFVLFGALTKRSIKSEDHYVLSVTSLVTHNPTTQENLSVLRNEMGVVLPQKAEIAAKDELKGLELTAHLFGVGMRYVISVALYVSGDRTSAISFLGQLKNDLSTAKLPSNWIGSQSLLRLVPKRLLDFHFDAIDKEFFEWRNDHDEQRLQLISSTFDELGDSWKKDVRYINMRAICHFAVGSNVAAARQLIIKGKSLAPDAQHWQYSLAFLDAYEGKFADAKKKYLVAFRADKTTGLSIEVEEFVHWIAAKDITRPQFHFFLGFINLLQKQDAVSAARDFQTFLDSPNLEQAEELVGSAKELLAKCQATLAFESKRSA
jgi:hypothetical protein